MPGQGTQRTSDALPLAAMRRAFRQVQHDAAYGSLDQAPSLIK